MLKRIRALDTGNLQTYLENRTEGINSETIIRVSTILQDVKTRRGDTVRERAQQFDGILLGGMRVEPSDIEAAAAKADPFFIESMKKAKVSIKYYHDTQKQNGYLLQEKLGVCLGRRVLPLNSVGIYVPGGRAQYPNSVLMSAVPARTAGVERIIMLAPPAKDSNPRPSTAAATWIAGVDGICKVGGAQGVAALAYSAQSTAPAGKIVGPRNVYVTAAKGLVLGKASADIIAGSSEVLVIMNVGAPAKGVAVDLLSRAEYDPMVSVILATANEQPVDAAELRLRKQSALLPKQEIVRQSLQAYGTAILCESAEECLDASNAVALEHLELMVKQLMDYLRRVRYVDSVSLGYHTYEDVGDYFDGYNRVSSIGGTARFPSAPGINSFTEESSYSHYSGEALQIYDDHIMEVTEQEELQAHTNVVKVRLRS